MASRHLRRAAVPAIVLGAVAALAGGAALAHNEPMPEGPLTPAQRAAHVRHAKFEEMGKAFKALNDELRKRNPDRTVLTSSTQTMNRLAGELPAWFPRGSGVEARPLSEARPNIWTDAAGFAAVASALQVEVGKLHQAASAGDADAVRAQVRATGGACKACHDKYRQQKS